MKTWRSRSNLHKLLIVFIVLILAPEIWNSCLHTEVDYVLNADVRKKVYNNDRPL